MICPTGRAEYFCAGEWTVESALIGLVKFDYWCKFLFVIPVRPNGSRECAPDDRLRPTPESIDPRTSAVGRACGPKNHL
jgi:hypothetical protein